MPKVHVERNATLAAPDSKRGACLLGLSNRKGFVNFTFHYIVQFIYADLLREHNL